MEQEIKGVYDLSENAKDVYKDINPDFDTPPTQEDLAYIRTVIKAHYAWVARRLGELRETRLDQCGTYALKLRAGKEVQNFQTGERFKIPDFYEVEFNAAPTLETLIQEQLKTPVPNVK